MVDYSALKEAFEKYVSGRLTADQLKPVAAVHGIYQQRDGRFMLRERVNGGVIDGPSLTGLADILDAVGGRAHLTTRQDFQLHDVPAERVLEAVSSSDRLGWPFKGGGGNTYRNTVVSSDSGLDPEGAFDVYPYAEVLQRSLRAHDPAYALPRKFKIGLYSGERELLKAAVQDLGFVARRRGGRRGFGVYAGGGLGRESAVGVCLVEFLPAERLVQMTYAVIALFHDHGDRSNRQRARLRFVLQRLGVEAFMRLLWGYYVTADAPEATVSPEAETVPVLSAADACRGEADVPPEEAEAYANWRELAVTPTRYESWVAVRLFVPYGNLTPRHLRQLVCLAGDFCACKVRLTTSQDVLLPLVRVEAVPSLFLRLRRDFATLDLTFRSFKGHIVTCVGATLCKIGMADAPAVGDRLAEALDAAVAADTRLRLPLQRLAADEVRISGCPNACSGHWASRVGIGCLNQRAGGEVVVRGKLVSGADAADGVPRLSEEEHDGLHDVAALVASAVRRMKEMAGRAGFSHGIASAESSGRAG